VVIIRGGIPNLATFISGVNSKYHTRKQMQNKEKTENKTKKKTIK
jgi:hypothetical protein